MKSVGIKQGISIKWLTQLISSYYWSKPRLGPAVAKNVSELFEGDIYEKIRETPPELAFQLFLVDGLLWDSRNELAKTKAYIRNLRSYEYFTLFSLIVRSLSEAGAKWSAPALSTLLHGQWGDEYKNVSRYWDQLTKSCIDGIIVSYKKSAKKYAQAEKRTLTHANFFKSQSYIRPLVNGPLPPKAKTLAKQVLGK